MMRIASLRRAALCTKASPSKPPAGQATHDADGKPLPSIPDSTTLFRMSNPELLLDPRKNAHWAIVAGTVVFFGIYLGVTAYREGLFDASGASAEQAAKEQREKVDVVRVLPDGRTLLRDGSIVRR